jgi:biopolymer transport protein ExbD
MSDIAFLLLIFFLVTTIFATERGINMVLPKNAPPVKVKRDNVLTVQAHADGSVTVDNESVTLARVREIAEDRLASNEKLIVVLESHADSEYGLMVDLLDELRLARVSRVTLKKMRS